MQFTETIPHHLYQIYFDEISRKNLDPGFLPLDNSKNERPDWREYWPIRQFLIKESLNENALYGFLSHKFFQKTGLHAREVKNFIENQPLDTDAIIFSPFFDQAAFFLNIYEQGVVAHPGSQEIFDQCVSLIDPSININTLVMDSRTTSFCNFIIAKPKFWRLWLEKCELIYSVSELKQTPLGRVLCGNVQHDTTAAIKTFVIERMASLLFSGGKIKNIRAYPSIDLPFSSSRISSEKATLICMNALKIAYNLEGNNSYLEQFHQLRKKTLEKLNFQI